MPEEVVRPLTRFPYDPAVIHRRFTHHLTSADQHDRMDVIRGRSSVLASEILSLVPPGREQSLALSFLEQVMFWANAGIARGIEPPAPEEWR